MLKHTNKKKNCHWHRVIHFTLVEIVVTLVVVVLGIIGLIALYPIGLNSQQQALGTSFANDAAEHFLRLSSTNIKIDWKWAKTFANEQPGSTEPKTEDWRTEPLVNYGNVKISPTSDFDPESDNNNGLFLLELSTENTVDFKGILRAWKTVTELDGDGKSAVLNVQLDWPYDIPYDSPNRNRELYTLEVYKPPRIAVARISDDDCSVTKYHGGGFSTTLSSVMDNGNGSYRIEYTVEHDGCGGPDCPELEHYSLEASPGSYVELDFRGVNGEFDFGPDLDGDSFDGFGIMKVTGIGNGVAGTFTTTFVLVDSLQDQQVSAHAGGEAYIVTFLVSEFESVISCIENNPQDIVDDGCPDIETGVVHTYDEFEIKFFCEDVQVKTRGEANISAVEVYSQNGRLAEFVTTIGDNWSNIPLPIELRPYSKVRLQRGGQWSEWIFSDTSCGSYNKNPPKFPNPTILRPDRNVKEYFCYGIGTENIPTDADGDELSYTIGDGPDWLYWDEDTQQIAGTPTDVGTYTWTITVDDGCHAAKAKIIITVLP